MKPRCSFFPAGMAALGTARRTPLVAKARPVTVCSPVVVATQVAPVVPTSLPVAVPSVAFDSFATAPVPSQHPSHASPYLPPPQAAAPPVHGGGGEQVVGMVLPGPFPQQAGYGFAYPPFLATPAVSPAPALRPPLILSAQPQPQPQEPALAGFTAVSAPPPAAAPVTCTLARERALAAAPPAAEPEAEVAARAVLEDEGLLSAALALVEASSGGPSAYARMFRQCPGCTPKLDLGLLTLDEHLCARRCSSPRSQVEGHNACSPLDLSFLDGPAFASDPNAHHPTPKQPRSSSQSQPSRGRASHYNAAKGIDRLHLSPRCKSPPLTRSTTDAASSQLTCPGCTRADQRGDASRSRSGRDSHPQHVKSGCPCPPWGALAEGKRGLQIAIWWQARARPAPDRRRAAPCQGQSRGVAARDSAPQLARLRHRAPLALAARLASAFARELGCNALAHRWLLPAATVVKKARRPRTRGRVALVQRVQPPSVDPPLGCRARRLTPDFGKLWSLPQKWVRKEPNAARVVAGARVGADSMDTSTD
jgi:hypothetical protein